MSLSDTVFPIACSQFSIVLCCPPYQRLQIESSHAVRAGASVDTPAHLVGTSPPPPEMRAPTPIEPTAP